MAAPGGGLAAGRKSIPGFYYDEGRNRYFRLRPGEKLPKLSQRQNDVSIKEKSAAKADGSSRTCNLHRYFLQREYNGLISGNRRHTSLDLWRFARMRWRGIPSHWGEGYCTQIATDGEGDIIAGIFEGFSSASSWLRVFKVVRASSGGMELHPMHQEEELGTRSSLYSSSTILPPQRLKLLGDCHRTTCLTVTPSRCSALTIDRHGRDQAADQSTTGYTIAKGRQQRLSRAPQCYAVTWMGKKASDVMIALGHDSHIEVYPSWSKHKSPPPWSACTSLCFTKEGDLISGHRSGRVTLRKHSQLFHGNSLPAYEFCVKGPGSSVVNLHALPHGNHVVTQSSNGQLSLWDWRLRRVVYSYAAAQDDWALQLERCHPVSALSSDGNVLAAVCRSEVTTCKLWSSYTGELLASVSLSHTTKVPCSHVTQVPPPDDNDVTVNSMSFVRQLGLEAPFPALTVGHLSGVLIVS